MTTAISQFRADMTAMEGQFKAALPAHIPAERFSRVVITAIQNNSKLLKVPRAELWNACIKAAQDGLLPDGREGALVVRHGRNLSVTWQVMIAGIRKKARNSGEISTWDAHVVHENDTFIFQLGDTPHIEHSYNLKSERGEPVGAYSVAVLKDGSKSYEVMSVSDINNIRDRSTAWAAFKAKRIKTTPWDSDWGEMARKTVARRHSKVLPMSSDLDDLMRRDDELYNFAGTDTAVVKDNPVGGLVSKMEALATPDDVEDIDPDTGEITEDKKDPASTKSAKNPAKGKAQDKNSEGKSSQSGSAFVGAASGDEAEGSERKASKAPSKSNNPFDIDRALDRGTLAAENDISRKDIPSEYQNEGAAELKKAWLDAYDLRKEELNND